MIKFNLKPQLKNNELYYLNFKFLTLSLFILNNKNSKK